MATTSPTLRAPAPHAPRDIDDQPMRVDRWFGRTTTTAGVTVFVLMGLIGLFLLLRSREAFDLMGFELFTTIEWDTTTSSPRIGVRGLVGGTVLVGLTAFLIAVPLGVCAALFITEFASPRLRTLLTALVDLLAAIPSLLYGLWGLVYLQDKLIPLSDWLGRHFPWIPIFEVEKDDPNLFGSIYIAGIVVSLMVIPIVASVTREVFSQTPPGEKEAALALGGTRWGMVRRVVLPYGRGGIIGGAMLGLGRALGETIAVALLLPQVPMETARILEQGGATISGFIVTHIGGNSLHTAGLMGAGLVLFCMTLLTNMVASVIIARSRSGVGVDL